MMNRCSVCENYLVGLAEPRCKFCNFEWAKELIRDDWDIFNERDSWAYEHSIRDRLWAKGIECLGADIWGNDDMAIVFGCSNASELAQALNVHKECLYPDPIHDYVIINLYQEKDLRNGVEK